MTLDAQMAATWPPEAQSVPAARQWLRACLLQWNCQALEGVTALVLAELSTNAVLHARTPFTVTLARMSDGLLIRVNDGTAIGPGPTTRSSSRQLSPDELTVGGLGLDLVEALTAGWGMIDDERGGKVVWALIGEAQAVGDDDPERRSAACFDSAATETGPPVEPRHTADRATATSRGLGDGLV